MYGCDCDGVSRVGPLDLGREGEALRGYIKTIEHVTGHAPPTCPWRAFSEPIVAEVLSYAWAVPEGNLEAATGPDSDHKLMQAMGVYQRAKNAAAAEERRMLHEEAEAKKRAKAQAAKAGARG